MKMFAKEYYDMTAHVCSVFTESYGFHENAMYKIAELMLNVKKANTEGQKLLNYFIENYGLYLPYENLPEKALHFILRNDKSQKKFRRLCQAFLECCLQGIKEYVDIIIAIKTYYFTTEADSIRSRCLLDEHYEANQKWTHPKMHELQKISKSERNKKKKEKIEEEED